MRIEIRDDTVVIDGYVNAVERESRIIHDRMGDFVEKIKAGAFQRAIERAERTSSPIRVLLNHRYDRELTSTKEPETKLFEDAVGLRCICVVRDAEVVRKAKERKLKGWSFGFIALRENREGDGIQRREVRELDLKEVSVLDDTKIPAYEGTTIEARGGEQDDLVEIRMFDDRVEVTEVQNRRTEDIYEFENRYLSALVGGK